MKKLTDLPNIGEALARKLIAAGIETPSELKRLGSVEALRRVRDMPQVRVPCMNMLCALEGAIQGIRWHDILRSERKGLWQSCQTEWDPSVVDLYESKRRNQGEGRVARGDCIAGARAGR
ncbi:MAG: TfoX/Sxy family protein [Phycisphaerales bacterium]|nr:MAG: TfoX/Sxy family protein [Phycisphaerales bacterium]